MFIRLTDWSFQSVPLLWCHYRVCSSSWFAWRTLHLFGECCSGIVRRTWCGMCTVSRGWRPHLPFPTFNQWLQVKILYFRENSQGNLSFFSILIKESFWIANQRHLTHKNLKELRFMRTNLKKPNSYLRPTKNIYYSEGKRQKKVKLSEITLEGK